MFKNPCPICGKDMDCYRDKLDGHILMEESNVCFEGHYAYEFLTGVYSVRVGELTLTWNYNTPFKEIERYGRAIDKLVERYKRQHPLQMMEYLIAETKKLIEILKRDKK